MDFDRTSIEMEARRTIEKVFWRFGGKGDSCANATIALLSDLHDAGYRIVPADSWSGENGRL